MKVEIVGRALALDLIYGVNFTIKLADLSRYPLRRAGLANFVVNAE